MSLTLNAVITAARDRHPAFHRTRVTNAVLARFLTDYQNELLAKAVIRDRQYLAQTAVISIALASSAASASGAGGSGSPGTVSDDTFATTDAPVGSAIEARVTAAEGATVWITESLVSSATSTTTTKTGAGRTTNGDIGRLLVIVAGTGTGQRREVLSNTADTWTHATWETVPDATSMFTLVSPVLESDDTAGLVTALPASTSTYAYAVKLDDAGVPYIDYTDPLTATIEHGVTLPAMQALLPDLCQYWGTGATDPAPLFVTNAQRRFTPERFPAIYTIGQTVYLTGTSAAWTDIASLELRYAPVAPTFTALTDAFLLPDAAQPALVARAVAFMALRVAGMADVTIDPAPYAVEADRAERAYLQAVTLGKRGRSGRVREVW